ncbi:MAG TPA: YbaK/EbsC family protein, partial [Terriglobia bacterium]|nr:YbaK/EbsC family protein [Terriglobia bacterium]
GANLEKAGSKAPPVEDPADAPAPEPFPTPGLKTIDDLVRSTGESATRMIKTLDYYAAQSTYAPKMDPVVILLRGEHTLSETKLALALGTGTFRPATPEEAFALHGAHLGSLGPVGLQGVRIVADRALEGRRDLITGANRDDTHLRHVTPGRDFKAEFHDVRAVVEGDLCERCGKPLQLIKTLELGHVFKLGRRYSETMHASVLDQAGKEVPLVMGSYGIGLERILSAAAEQNHDADGMFLPRSIAPFDVVLTAANTDDAPLRQAAEKLYGQMLAASIDVLFDDRQERPGVKFKDADLVGVPFRVTLGKRKFLEGKAEILTRSTKQSRDVKLENVVEVLRGEYLH